ncbi:MAG TPA: ABC transporter permease [Candidatus Nanoarchaeia archaeon]|nr:ABC transporter permease [Candidatus Nanoarchaeia archaeon]
MFLNKLLRIVGKNIKLILRSKGSALIVVFGPLFLIMMVGTAFNSASLYGIRVGVYSEEYSPLADSMIKELSGKNFAVNKLVSQDECIKGIKDSIIHICAIFPKGLSVENQGQITFYVDPSRTNLVYSLMDTITSKIATKSDEISLQLTNTIVNTLKSTGDQLAGQTVPLNSILIASSKSTNLAKASDDLLTQQDFVIRKTKFDQEFDSLESNVEALKTQFNFSTVGIYGPMNRIRALVDEAQAQMDANAKLKSQVAAKLGEIKNANSEIVTQGTLMENIFKTMINGIKAVAEKDARKIVSPINAKIEPVVAEKTYLNYLFPTLVIMVIMFISILLVADLVIKEKTSTAYFRNYISPTSDLLFIIGIYITALLIILLQMILIFAVAYYFFRGSLLSALPNVSLILLCMSLIFISIGLIIGYLFRSEETGTLAAISLSSIMLFLSNTILPLESMPAIFKQVALYNPFVIGEDLLRKALLFNYPLKSFVPVFYVLGAMFIGLMFLVLVSNISSKKSLRA